MDKTGQVVNLLRPSQKFSIYKKKKSSIAFFAANILNIFL